MHWNSWKLRNRHDRGLSSRPSRPLLALGTVMLFTLSPVAAQQSSGDSIPAPGAASDEQLDIVKAFEAMAAENPVVAIVEGDEIRWEEILRQAEALPEEYKEKLAAVFPSLIDRSIDLKLLAKAGEQAGLAENPAVMARIEAFTEIALRDAYVAQRLSGQITDDLVFQRYQRYLSELPPREKIHARHIVVASEREAWKVIGALGAGADFAELAKARSTGPTAAQGGDLGFFTRGRMVPAFEEAAFALEVGQFSQRPVQTEFGWHVIKLEAREVHPVPSFEQMSERLRGDLARELLRSHLDELRTEAEIEVFPGLQSKAE